MKKMQQIGDILIKRIDGQNFKVDGHTFLTKRAASEVAEDYRNNGYKARVSYNPSRKCYLVYFHYKTRR